MSRANDNCCFCSNAYWEILKLFTPIRKRQRYGKVLPDEGTRKRLVCSKETFTMGAEGLAREECEAPVLASLVQRTKVYVASLVVSAIPPVQESHSIPMSRHLTL